MRTFLSILVLCSALLPAASAGSFLDFLLPKHDVQVITVTDTTPTGALLRPASPVSPVFYVAINAGFRDFGGIVAGEKLPSTQEVIKTMTKVLAKQGYLPATQSHPPSLILLWTWGTMNTDMTYAFPSNNPNDSSYLNGRQINRSQMLRFLGAYKLGMVSQKPDVFQTDLISSGLFLMGADRQAIYDLATDDLYVVAIAAYDFQAAMRKEKKQLWTTKISCPSRGLWLPDVLPAMLAIAGPYIGKETDQPVWINASDKFKPDIKIGDPTLVEFIESDKLPVIDGSHQVAGKGPHGQKKAPAPKR